MFIHYIFIQIQGFKISILNSEISISILMFFLKCIFNCLLSLSTWVSTDFQIVSYHLHILAFKPMQNPLPLSVDRTYDLNTAKIMGFHTCDYVTLYKTLSCQLTCSLLADFNEVSFHKSYSRQERKSLFNLKKLGCRSFPTQATRGEPDWLISYAVLQKTQVSYTQTLTPQKW